MFFPIRLKILSVLVSIVIGALGVYLYLATNIIYSDKTLLTYELTQNNVKILSSEVSSQLYRVIDKLKIYTSLFAKDENLLKEAEFSGNIDSNENLIVRLGILNPTGAQIFDHPVQSFLELNKLDSTYLASIRQNRPIPFDTLTDGQIWIRSSTLPSHPQLPLITLAFPFRGKAGEKNVIFADIHMDAFVSSFKNAGAAEVYMTDAEGFILAHSKSLDAGNFALDKADPLLGLAQQSKVSSEVKQIQDEKKNYLAAFSKVGVGGLFVFSKIEQEKAFQAASLLLKKSTVYASMILTVAFLIAMFMAHGLTRPIEAMVSATNHIAKGEFDSQVPITTHDELAQLAKSFNSMSKDLKKSRLEIEDYSRGLEIKVAERTADLEEKNIAIKKTQEALIRTTRLASVGEVAGRAAHEVLNPLTNISMRLEKIKEQNLKVDQDDIKLFSTIISAWYEEYKLKGKDALFRSLQKPGTPDQQGRARTLLDEDIENLIGIAIDMEARAKQRFADIDFLSKESERISKIVNNMRSLTRVSGQKKIIDVHGFLNEAIATVTDLLSKENIQIRMEKCSSEPKVFIDSDELLQVMNNIIRNSQQALTDHRKNNPEFNGEISIMTSVDAQGVAIRIVDNGPGISTANKEEVFEASFTTKSVEDGTGLGLSIARRLVRAYEGDLILEKSEPLVATVFLITLPEAQA